MARKLLQKINNVILSRIPSRRYSMKNFQFFSDANDSEIPMIFEELFMRKEPSFVTRLGGNEFESAAFYLNNPRTFVLSGFCRHYMEKLQNYAGYFDFSHDKKLFMRYLQLLINSYESADAVTYANLALKENVEHNSFPRHRFQLMSLVAVEKPLINFTFIEALSPFLKSFTKWGAGKKILIVSPFSESLRIQHKRKDDLIPGYRFPEFDLITVQSRITYSTWRDTKESLNIDTNNWFEEFERLKKAIAAEDFDIAWLSCASYAGPLGAYIKNELGRHSLYMGGILNPIFNIYGERYDTSFYRTFSNPKTQIDPVENNLIEHIIAGRDTPNEAIRAYFGTRE